MFSSFLKLESLVFWPFGFSKSDIPINYHSKNVGLMCWKAVATLYVQLGSYSHKLLDLSSLQQLKIHESREEKV